MTWAVQGLGVGPLNGTERILAEVFAISLAIGATAFLQWWSKRRRVETFVEAEVTYVGRGLPIQLATILHARVYGDKTTCAEGERVWGPTGLTIPARRPASWIAFCRLLSCK